MISLRIGFEMTREHMTFILQKFFAAFNRVYDEAFTKNKLLEQSSQNLPGLFVAAKNNSYKRI